jgi:hypothetical protein
MCRVWLSVEDREFLLQKFRFAGFDHIARIRARQPRDMAARRLMLELDWTSHIHLPAQQCGATLASPSSDMAVSIGSMAYGRARRACLATPFASFKSR